MYQVIGVKRALSLFGLVSVGAFILLLIAEPPKDSTNIGQWWKVASAAVGDVGLLVWLVGQTAVFPYFCRLPIVRSWFPDIDGEWQAELESNWDIIAQRAGAAMSQPGGEPTRAKIVIISRLLFIRMNLTTQYSFSRTISVSATRSEEDGSLQIAYLYQNTTLKPLETDSATHNGAALVRVNRESNKEISMQGTYWTDRNWHKAMNTAGRITLRRRSA
jgi:hypothetical protein